jgi:hypothetical protein
MAVSAALALEGTTDKSGLHGILKSEVPTGLTADSFADLTGNWTAWGKDVAGLVAKLYTDEKLDVAGQRDLLKQIEKKIHTIDKALIDSHYASLYGPLTALRGRLARRIDVDRAILKTLELTPEEAKAARVKAARADALDALSALEADLNQVPNGSAWLPYLHANELRSELTSGKSDGLVAKVEQKLGGASSLKDPEQKKFLERPMFHHLSAALTKLQQASQTTPAAGDMQAVRGKLAALVSALEGYEDNGSSADAQKVYETLDAVDKSAMDGGELVDASVREHYMNYNLQVVVSQDMLNRLLSDQQSTSGPVTDFILGANVSGNETTTTDVSVELRPGTNAANMDLVLNGVTQSSTVGVTDQASIYTSGYHRWGATKPIHFDGATIVTEPAHMTYIQPSNSTTGASTRYSGIPLIGGIADSTAVQQAEMRRGESEAIAGQRLESRVLPGFDARVDQMIQGVDQQLRNDLHKRLKQSGVLPTAVRARSNDSYFRLSAQVAGPNQLAGDVGNAAGESGAGLVLSLHESLLNSALSHMNFAGRTMNDKQIAAELQSYLTKLLGRPVDFAAAAKKLAAAQAAMSGAAPAGAAPAPAKPQPASAETDEQQNSLFVFDKEDPIRFTIDDGQVKLVIRAGFKQEGKPDVPTQEITVPLQLVVNGGRLIVMRGTIGVSGGDVARSGVIKKKIASAIQPKIPLDPQIHVPRPGRPDFDLTIAKISAENGWLTIWAN